MRSDGDIARSAVIDGVAVIWNPQRSGQGPVTECMAVPLGTVLIVTVKVLKA